MHNILSFLISAGVEFDQLVKKVPSGLFRQAAFRIAKSFFVS